ncbi:MAG TPA: ATP-dependent DNA ligase [Pirellulales bacterium]|jgi:ATP-dependent DNA ligase|nr:ATP-dependent DNA ligase [Pirellulales bacterium]
MKLELAPPLPPMEAKSVDELPSGDRWQYEPKWDGFRCLAFRDGNQVELQSKSGQPLARYFPDLVESLGKLRARRFVLDGEIVIPIEGRLSFDELLLRVHPAESRVRKLAAEHPAMLIVFDLLADDRGRSLVERTLADRRALLEAFAEKYLPAEGAVRLSPATTQLSIARRWFKTVGGNLDGIIAKRLDLAYRSGRRDGMQKIKHRRTADCVVGGFRFAEGRDVVGSLLLGLFDREGLLDHVGFTSSFKQSDRARITKIVTPLVGPPGFTGRAPGGPSRWSTRRSDEWKPLKTKLVVEVQYDHFTGDRFRHGTQFLRWRPDKAPAACTMDQVAHRGGRTLKLLDVASH